VGRRRESPSRPGVVVSMARGVKFVVGFVGRCRRRKASWICEREKLIVSIPVMPVIPVQKRYDGRKRSVKTWKTVKSQEEEPYLLPNIIY